MGREIWNKCGGNFAQSEWTAAAQQAYELLLKPQTRSWHALQKISSFLDHRLWVVDVNQKHRAGTDWADEVPILGLRG